MQPGGAKRGKTNVIDSFGLRSGSAETSTFWLLLARNRCAVLLATIK